MLSDIHSCWHNAAQGIVAYKSAWQLLFDEDIPQANP